MVLLDAYALIALVAGESAATSVRALLHAGDSAIPSVNVAEVLDSLERVRHIPRERAWGAVEPLISGPVAVVPLTVEVARRAAELRAEHYHRRQRPLSLADCVLLASAREGDRIATADQHVLAVAPLIGIGPLPLTGEA